MWKNMKWSGEAVENVILCNIVQHERFGEGYPWSDAQTYTGRAMAL